MKKAAEGDLTLIKGVGEKTAKRLQDLGIASFSQMAELDSAKIREIEKAIGFKGRVEREEWVKQAKILASKYGHKSERTQPGPRRDQKAGPVSEEREPAKRPEARKVGMSEPPEPADAGAAKRPKHAAKPSADDQAEFCPEPLSRVTRRTTHAMDRAFRAHLARMTFSITPAGLAAHTFDWLVHLAISPGKQLELFENATVRFWRYLLYAGEVMTKPDPNPCFRPMPSDDRFEEQEWQRYPFNLIHQWFLLQQEFWDDATTDIEGLSKEEQKSLSFVARQLLDLSSPSNFIATNPKVLNTTIEQSGVNLLRGFRNAAEDWERWASGQPPVGAHRFQVGKDLARTPGKVVYRNHLMELIQYSSSTDTVRPEPILITPAWIMKYYILDLSPGNSFVKYLVDQGYTVFMISWHNPTEEDRDLDMNDYIRLGVFDALEAINKVVPDRKVHSIGYCIGGTLLLMAAAAMARIRDNRLATITLLAAQADFSEAGEILLFVNESQVSYLEALTWDQGYLDSRQMAGAFQMLQSNDLIWSRYVRTYLLGERPELFDLFAWNADGTRLPYKMHSEYLRKLFLENQLAQGRFKVGGAQVNLSHIEQPIFCVSTTEDHVAPWRSVYKLHYLVDTDVTFVLANRGHNGGIISEPGRKGREYHILTTHGHAKHVPPEDWRAEAPLHNGSWWPEYVDWLNERSGKPVKPPPIGAPAHGLPPLADAPGTYVFER